MGDYEDMFERFLEAVNTPGLRELDPEDLTAMTPQEFRDRAEAFFDPRNKPYDAGEDPGATRVRVDALRREATEKSADILSEAFQGADKAFVAKGVNRLQLVDEGSFTNRLFERESLNRITVDFEWGTMEQLRDEKGRIITARKV